MSSVLARGTVRKGVGGQNKTNQFLQGYCFQHCEQEARDSYKTFVILFIPIPIHCPKSNIVKRNVYLYSKKCLSGTEEMFLYCKSPC